MAGYHSQPVGGSRAGQPDFPSHHYVGTITLSVRWQVSGAGVTVVCFHSDEHSYADSRYLSGMF